MLGSAQLNATESCSNHFLHMPGDDRLCIQFALESTGIGTAHDRCHQLYNDPFDIRGDHAILNQKYTKKKRTASFGWQLDVSCVAVSIRDHFFICLSEPKCRHRSLATLRQCSTHHAHRGITKWGASANSRVGRTHTRCRRINLFGSPRFERPRTARFHLDVNGWHRLGILFCAGTRLPEPVG